MKRNIQQIVSDHLCMGCGICQDACPKKCINVIHGIKNRPQVKMDKCTECGRCLKVCAGAGIDLKETSNKLFGVIPYDKYIGRYLALFKGYSTDYNIRYHSASGGCLSQFLIYLLEQRVIDGAVVTGYSQNAPMQPRVYIARTKEEVLNGKSSKYCVVSLDGIVSEIKENEGKYVVVGLPCHIQSLRKLAEIDKKTRVRIIGYFPIYCSANKNMNSQEYLIWRYGVDKKRLKSFTYRDDGCLGSMFFRDKNNTNIVNPIEYLDYYCGLRAFFNEQRCNVCTDFFGEVGDICFGDLNKGEADDDSIGINSIVVRSERWLDILNECRAKGVLELTPISKEMMIGAQTYCSSYKKGKGFWATWKLRKIFGIKNPQYGSIEYDKPDIKAYKSAVSKIVMYEIGRHKSLWPIIKFLDKNKKQ